MAGPQPQTMFMFRNCLCALKCLTGYICPSRYIRLMIYSCENGSRDECSDGVQGAAASLCSSPYTADTHGKKKHLRPVSLTGNLASGFILQQVVEHKSRTKKQNGWREDGKSRWRHTDDLFYVSVDAATRVDVLSCHAAKVCISRIDLHINFECTKCGNPFSGNYNFQHARYEGSTQKDTQLVFFYPYCCMNMV